ncbi:peptidoglycan DD-metalloendopeptidase family protein [Heliobacillus mobilis]|uniref:Peptidoglycan DD-metalloendopeptidase family protein n=1 Tax=Heliobacterium mobile TaxID=28064 RepID=A0A6I3SPD4_HELMO|nr:M23 family metallopeptidase [Heliobacterium mobile]MTV50586.1 peptidoglycan DD-metalloendopeptidase family protein [Heliobacterium mobile]
MTIMFVPGTGEKSFSINLSPERARQMLIGGIIAGALGVLLLILSVYTLTQLSELHRLRSVNEEQAQKIEELQQFTLTVQDRLAKIKQLDKQIRRMVGIDGEEEKTIAPPAKDSEVIEDSSLVEPGNENHSLHAFAMPSRSGGTVPIAMSMDQEAIELDDVNTLSALLHEYCEELDQETTDLHQLNKEVGERLNYLAAVPSTYPVRGEITSPFGSRKSPFGVNKEFHTGLDLAADYGTPVRSAAKGKVVFTGSKPGLGNVVEVDHGYGFTTAYCHLSAITVKANDTVERGDQVGKVGNSGRSTGPHLHFMVKKDGQLQNPETYLIH